MASRLWGGHGSPLAGATQKPPTQARSAAGRSCGNDSIGHRERADAVDGKDRRRDIDTVQERWMLKRALMCSQAASQWDFEWWR